MKIEGAFDLMEKLVKNNGLGIYKTALNTIRKALDKSQKTLTNNERDVICPNYYVDRIPVNDDETNFESVSCCRTSGKLPSIP